MGKVPWLFHFSYLLWGNVNDSYATIICEENDSSQHFFFMQFLAPPSALSSVFSPDRQQSNVMWLCKVHRLQHFGSETVMCSVWKEIKRGHRARDRQNVKLKLKCIHLFFPNTSTTFPLDINSHCEYHSAQPLKPTEMFIAYCHRLSGIVVRCLRLQSQKTVNRWLLAFYLCCNSLLPVFSSSPPVCLSHVSMCFLYGCLHWQVWNAKLTGGNQEQSLWMKNVTMKLTNQHQHVFSSGIIAL